MRLIALCWIFAAVLLLLLVGCSSGYRKKGVEREASVVQLETCQADPDTVLVHKGGTVSWSVPKTDSHTYTIQFKSTPIPESTVTVNANAHDNPHPVKGDFWCKAVGSCLYAYTLTKEDGSICPDPGVHVIR